MSNVSPLKAQKLKQDTVQMPKDVPVTVLIIVSPRIVGVLTYLSVNSYTGQFLLLQLTE